MAFPEHANWEREPKAILIDHGSRIRTLEDGMKSIHSKLDWIIGLVITGLGGLLGGILLKHL